MCEGGVIRRNSPLERTVPYWQMRPRMYPPILTITETRKLIHVGFALFALALDLETIVSSIMLFTGVYESMALDWKDISVTLAFLSLALSLASSLAVLYIYNLDQWFHAFLVHWLPSEHSNMPQWFVSFIKKLRTVASRFTDERASIIILNRSIEITIRAFSCFGWMAFIRYAKNTDVEFFKPGGAHVSTEDIEKFHTEFRYLAAVTFIIAVYAFILRAATFRFYLKRAIIIMIDIIQELAGKLTSINWSQK